MAEEKGTAKEIQAAWDSWSDHYYQEEYENTGTLDALKKSPQSVFPPEVWSCLRLNYQSLHGIRVCVPSSGDNLAAFAFYLLGAKVTSCDISGEQINNAQRVAAEQGFSLDFRVCDSMG